MFSEGIHPNFLGWLYPQQKSYDLWPMALYLNNIRSSRSQMFLKIRILSLQLYLRDSNTCFPVNVAKFLWTIVYWKPSVAAFGYQKENIFTILISETWNAIPTNIYLFKVSNRNVRNWSEMCSKLTMKTPARRQWGRSGVFIANFEHISLLCLVFQFLILSK